MRTQIYLKGHSEDEYKAVDDSETVFVTPQWVVLVDPRDESISYINRDMILSIGSERGARIQYVDLCTQEMIENVMREQDPVELHA